MKSYALTGILFLGSTACSLSTEQVRFADAGSTAGSATAIGSHQSLDLEERLKGSQGVSGGVAILDIDGNGTFDIAFSNAQRSPNSLYLGTGGAWSKSTRGDLTDLEESTSALCWGDVDADGRWDAVAANQHGEDNSRLRQREGGNFEAYALLPSGGDNYECRFGDFTGDGRPDLAISDFGGGVRIYRNSQDGDLQYDDLLSSSIGSQPAGGINWVDVDFDGDMDLFVTRPGSANSLYKNVGGGLVAWPDEELGDLATEVALWVGGSWADFDNDGDLDLFMANLEGPNALFEQQESGFFLKSTSATSDEGQSWVGLWADLNNDGHLDIYVTNYGDLDSYYLADGSGGFSGRQLFEGSFSNLSSGVAAGDIDGDGSVEIAIANWDGQDNELLTTKDLAAGNWIQFDVVGPATDPMALGTRIVVRHKDQRSLQKQTRIVGGVDGLRSQSSNRLHFGIGNAASIETVEIHWPDGTMSSMKDISPNQIIVITHPGN